MTKDSDPLPSLDELQRKIDEVKPEGDEKQDPASAADVNIAVRAGADLAAGLAVGGFIGFFADRWLHTSPVFFILCFFLGATAGFRNMARSIQKQPKD